MAESTGKKQQQKKSIFAFFQRRSNDKHLACVVTFFFKLHLNLALSLLNLMASCLAYKLIIPAHACACSTSLI